MADRAKETQAAIAEQIREKAAKQKAAADLARQEADETARRVQVRGPLLCAVLAMPSELLPHLHEASSASLVPDVTMFTLQAPSLPCRMQKVLQRSKIRAKLGACAANIPVVLEVLQCLLHMPQVELVLCTANIYRLSKIHAMCRKQFEVVK